LALSAFVGPFGAIHRRESWAQPGYDESNADMVYPIFHVVRFLSAMGGAARLSIRTAGNDIAGIASHHQACIRLVVANVGTEASRIRLPREAEIRSLNAHNFQSAIHDPKWLDTGKADRGSDVALQPLDVAFIGMQV
jgi:hypothetical protein